MSNRKVVLYIACSVDGYIAMPNDDLSFLSFVEREGEDYGYNNFLQSIDTVILGRKTYDWVMTQVDIFPHANIPTYVITRTPKPKIGNIEFYSGNVKALIQKLKTVEGKNIFIDGGADIVNLLLKDKLIDEIILSVIPVILGEGIKLFGDFYPSQMLKLIECQSFPSGLVQLYYSID